MYLCPVPISKMSNSHYYIHSLLKLATRRGSTLTMLKMNGRVEVGTLRILIVDLILILKMLHLCHPMVGLYPISKLKNQRAVTLYNLRILLSISVFYSYIGRYLLIPSSNCACYDLALA